MTPLDNNKFEKLKAREDIDKTNTETMSKVKALKCHVCKKKLNTTLSYKCKCDLNLCLQHRFPDSHDCSFNFVKEHQMKLNNTLIRVDHEKITKI